MPVVHKNITDEFGVPVHENDYALSKTVGQRGPIVLDTRLINKLAHFDGERIPERVVHAKGSGAKGFFQLTHDMSDYTTADFLTGVGKKTAVLARFSTVGGEKGSADTARDPRGFAVKHYTSEGNYDFVGNNTPVFFIRDGMQFPDFIHTQKRDPKTNMNDPVQVWDFFARVPETTHQVTVLFSDRGTPDGYRHMNGYSGHSFILRNSSGERFIARMHYKTNQGIKTLSRDDAQRIAGEDPDYAQRDLTKAIDRGAPPSWTLYYQILPEAEALALKESKGIDVLDITQVIPQGLAPLKPVGLLVLDTNVENYFAEIEQAAFSPGNLVPGIEASNDKMLQARLFSYPDTHRHRLGRNYQEIPVNCPFATRVDVFNRDGAASVSGNHGPVLNYIPNQEAADSKQSAPSTCPRHKQEGEAVEACMLARHKVPLEDTDFRDAGVLYSRVMSDADRTALIGNIAGSLVKARLETQRAMVGNFARADMDYGRRVAEAIGITDLDFLKVNI